MIDKYGEKETLPWFREEIGKKMEGLR